VSALKGLSLKQLLSYKGFGANSSVAVNVGKVLPATTTGNLFSVTGSVQVLSLVGVVSTAFSVTAVKPTIGITGSAAAIAAAPAAGYASTTAGSLIQLPAALGGALPAAISASQVAASSQGFEASGTNITITTDATNTGAVTWILVYVPLFRKFPGVVANL
jgi:hypothetical protein